jgi:hypothetical protein
MAQRYRAIGRSRHYDDPDMNELLALRPEDAWAATISNKNG